MIEKIAALKAQGRTFSQIAAELGISKGQARGLWQRHRHDAAVPQSAGHPKGWEPGVTLEDGRSGTLSLPPSSQKRSSKDFEDYLAELGFDPAEFEIVEPFQVRSWDALRRKDDQTEIVRLWYYRANIVRRKDALSQADVAELIESVRSRPLPTPTVDWSSKGRHGYIVVIADPQFGKGDGGGTKAVVERFGRCMAGAEERLRELRSLGREIDEVHLAFMGDGIEGTHGHYAQQTFRSDLNRRDMERVCRENYLAAIERFLPLVDPYRLNAEFVPGNHPENRLNGKAHTDFWDNFDLAVADQLRLVADAGGAQVRFRIPDIDDQDMSVVVDVHETILGLAHGQQMRHGSTPEQRVENWWKGQMMGRHPIGNADILITAHLHHYIAKELVGRWWFQAPALENRSDWVKQTGGNPGRPGVLTFTTSGGLWRDVQVMS